MSDPFADVDAVSSDLVEIIAAALETRAADPAMLPIIDAIRALIRDVFAWAMAHLVEGEKDPNPSVFANLETELAGLPGRFGPLSGYLLLARLDGVPAGCAAVYGQDAETMEIERMFVRSEAWGQGVDICMEMIAPHSCAKENRLA